MDQTHAYFVEQCKLAALLTGDTHIGRPTELLEKFETYGALGRALEDILKPARINLSKEIQVAEITEEEARYAEQFIGKAEV